ncbi:hypothetical protein Tco_0465300 [Tanacetum coccineum]
MLRDRSIGIDIPVCLGLTLVKQTQFHLSQLRMLRVEHLHGLIYDGVRIGILACRGLPPISPLHAKKSHPQIRLPLQWKYWGVTDNTLSGHWLRVYSRNVSITFNQRACNSPEQEAATGHSIPRRLDSPTSRATQLPELELTLTPATGRELSQEINSYSVPILISQALGPSRKRSRSHHRPSYLIKKMPLTFSDDAEDKELLISELQDSPRWLQRMNLPYADKGQEDAENRRAEDHKQI